jgi:hypothetical protein
MTQAKTERADSYFRACESADGTPWIICEPQGKTEIAALNDGFIGFGLRPGTSLQEAGKLAELLRGQITDVSVTTFNDGAAELTTRHRR